MKRMIWMLVPLSFVVLLTAFYLWVFCRIAVPPGYMAIITAKTGRPLPPNEILAAPGEKGIRLAPLPEGRHFLNPVTHDWRIVPLVRVPVGKVGVVTSKVGKELPPGEILAVDKAYKGVWRDVLGPGIYRLNPERFDVVLRDAVNIPIGYVGIVTSQTGTPVKTGEFAEAGQQGVMREVLQPGLYYINPRAYQVDVLEIGMNQVSILGRSGSVVLTKGQISNASTALDSLQQNTIQTQKEKRDAYLEKNRDRGFISQQALSAPAVADEKSARMKSSSISKHVGSAKKSVSSSQDAPSLPNSFNQQIAVTPESIAFGLDRFVEFPSRDGFQILLDMTVEFELLPENISRIYMAYGDLPAVVEKIILPQVLSISRIKGSSYKARDFIDGEGRQLFQQEMTEELTRVLKEKHIVIHNAIIRHVEIPSEILLPIQESSLAKEQDLTNKSRQETARKQAELNTETAMIEQLRKQVDQESEKIVATIAAGMRKEVAGIEADTALEVAKINLQKAEVQAEITEIQGVAKVKSEFMVANEQAHGMQLRAEVFKNPSTLADLMFVEQLNPEIGIRILHAGEGTLWTDLKALTPTLPVK